MTMDLDDLIDGDDDVIPIHSASVLDQQVENTSSAASSVTGDAPEPPMFNSDDDNDDGDGGADEVAGGGTEAMDSHTDDGEGVGGGFDAEGSALEPTSTVSPPTPEAASIGGEARNGGDGDGGEHLDDVGGSNAAGGSEAVAAVASDGGDDDGDGDDHAFSGRGRALYTFDGGTDGDLLPTKRGEELSLVRIEETSNWLEATNASGETGYVARDWVVDLPAAPSRPKQSRPTDRPPSIPDPAIASGDDGRLIHGRYSLANGVDYPPALEAGEVWITLAWDEDSTRKVHLEWLAGADGHAGMTRQLEMVRATAGPGVAAMLDYLVHPDETGGCGIFVFEAPDMTLREYMDYHDLSTSEIAYIAYQVLAGLQTVHDADVVHGDVRPENIGLYGREWKLSGFSRARRLGSPDPFPARYDLYTPLQATARLKNITASKASDWNVKRDSDIWQFGLLLYEMATGERRIRDVDIPGTNLADSYLRHYMDRILEDREYNFERTPCVVRCVLCVCCVLCVPIGWDSHVCSAPRCSPGHTYNR